MIPQSEELIRCEAVDLRPFSGCRPFDVAVPHPTSVTHQVPKGLIEQREVWLQSWCLSKEVWKRVITPLPVCRYQLFMTSVLELISKDRRQFFEAACRLLKTYVSRRSE